MPHLKKFKILSFSVLYKSHITRWTDNGMSCIFREKQACITRRQSSKLYENTFVQVIVLLRMFT